MNVFQSMKFCVMEDDNRLKKKGESFLDSFAARFSYKKTFSRSAMFKKNPEFRAFFTRPRSKLVCCCSTSALFISIFGQIASDSLRILVQNGNSIEI